MDVILFTALLAFLLGFTADRWFFLTRGRGSEDTNDDAEDGAEPAAGGESGAPPDDATAADNGAEQDPIDELRGFSRDARPFFENITHAKDLYQCEPFVAGIELLVETKCPLDILIQMATGTDAVLACMALAALARHDQASTVTATLLEHIATFYPWQLYFALLAVDAHHEGPIAGQILARGRPEWVNHTAVVASLAELLDRRIAAGESPTFGGLLGTLLPDGITALRELLSRLGAPRNEALVAELDAWDSARTDRAFLHTVGRVAEDPREVADIVGTPEVRRCLKEARAALFGIRPRALVVVGEAGTGKSAVLHLIANEARAAGWTIFEASALEVHAGQVYVGQIEGRIKELVDKVHRRRNILWMGGDLQQFHSVGRHLHSRRGLLELLTPAIEARDVLLVTEARTEAFERLLLAYPSLQTMVAVVRLAALDQQAAEEVALAATAAWKTPSGVALFSGATLREAGHLARQYLGQIAPPGNVMNLLRLCREEAVNAEIDRAIGTEDLVGTLSKLSGLPRDILDERHPLDLDALRALFNRRVLGQAEAVECLIERVAMIKAGLTDPTRPAGIFLFVGPTGTGKTEIARTLATFLFGSPDRMIRLDMSEFMSPESLSRIVGSADPISESTALVDEIRKQPFSVVLLDEIEKAHASVWDLFLQVFDAGRLTDRRGNAADFRHCTMILTSNLGSALPAGVSIGFAADSGHFSTARVQRAVGETFRPEFLNRVDRVVVFHPLSRTIMRSILLKELADVLDRRGFRRREWAVEWEESALGFLLRVGFSQELGARPLKRAIDRYFLSPLALTIVNRQAPEGDQFLFVRSAGDALEVSFIDPDAPPAASGEASVEAPSAEGEPDLRALVTLARGTTAELAVLEGEHARLHAAVSESAWMAAKATALSAMSAKGFWDSASRRVTLTAIERMDRIEAAVASSASLLDRLRHTRRERGSGHTLRADLARSIAEQLFLTSEAHASHLEGLPDDAIIAVEASTDSPALAADASDFARALASMYECWAKKRGFVLIALERQVVTGENSGAATANRSLFAIGGPGAYRMLRAEAGLHVLEIPRDERSFARAKVRVRVLPQPECSADSAAGLRNAAFAAMAAEAAESQAIVRRYRRAPSPLVRDGVRDARTGRLDRVLEGNFDVLP
ncbi:MAG: AAA family ATPase [Candidatus Schekmanbacteria bacterium]|nr:AAA family ATPase [Candidatus Schekmanbacteria bacterium]